MTREIADSLWDDEDTHLTFISPCFIFFSLKKLNMIKGNKIGELPDFQTDFL